MRQIRAVPRPTTRIRSSSCAVASRINEIHMNLLSFEPSLLLFASPQTEKVAAGCRVLLVASRTGSLSDKLTPALPSILKPELTGESS